MFAYTMYSIISLISNYYKTWEWFKHRTEIAKLKHFGSKHFFFQPKPKRKDWKRALYL